MKQKLSKQFEAVLIYYIYLSIYLHVVQNIEIMHDVHIWGIIRNMVKMIQVFRPISTVIYHHGYNAPRHLDLLNLTPTHKGLQHFSHNRLKSSLSTSYTMFYAFKLQWIAFFYNHISLNTMECTIKTPYAFVCRRYHDAAFWPCNSNIISQTIVTFHLLHSKTRRPT